MNKPKGPSQRQLRVGEEIRHILAEVLSHGHSGNELLDRSSITVTEVRVSPDLHNATVFIVPLGGLHVPEILSAFKERSWYFRKEVAHKLQTRVAPRLVFQADLTFDEAQHIESLLRSPRVRRDIEEKD
ncbi:MAG TPA: 30S ribosome-binding factor RbfA [Alphaproteobacteria bacterium]|nr:30S ribosome-binding factor RbfA [Alphaproteobacteria bacterium]